MQRDTENTRQSHGFLEIPQATEALIPSVLDTSGPTTPTNRPHQHADPTGNNRPLRNNTQRTTNKPLYVAAGGEPAAPANPRPGGGRKQNQLCATASACSRSATRSSASSMPTLRRSSRSVSP